MSGTKSSDPTAADVEALSFTVHSMPAPDLTAQQRRRQVSGRLRMLLVLLACAAPVIASYLTYYVVRPEGRTNYSDLISPSKALPADLALHTLEGQRIDTTLFKGQWLLLIVSSGDCREACEQRVYLQRQLREMLGKERGRVDRLWLLTDGATPTPALQEAAHATEGLIQLRTQREALAAWLSPAPGQALEDHVYIVDPMGQWMMRAPVDPQPAKLKRDLDRLLRASSSWDHEGR